MSKRIPVNVVTKKHSHSNIRLIETLMSAATAMLARHGDPLPDAKKMSEVFIIEVCRQLKSELIYFGKNSAFDTQMRHWAIKEDFRNGATIEQLAFKHSLSTRQINTIVYHKKDLTPIKAATTGAPVVAILATRMMMKAGLEQDDAVSATRGLLAVIATKLGGTAQYITSPRFAEGIIKQIEIVGHYQAGKSIESLAAHFGLLPEEIRDILKNYPQATMPDASELPKIKTRLFNMVSSFSGYPEINTLLESAVQNISRSEEIIKKLEGAKL